MATYRDLIAWQKALVLAEAVYRVSSQFPSDERYGLVSQLRRAAVSIAFNIAEGHGRRSRPEFDRFLRIALGSVREVETQIILSGGGKFADRDDLADELAKAEEVGLVINGLLRS